MREFFLRESLTLKTVAIVEMICIYFAFNQPYVNQELRILFLSIARVTANATRPINPVEIGHVCCEKLDEVICFVCDFLRGKNNLYFIALQQSSQANQSSTRSVIVPLGAHQMVLLELKSVTL